MDGQPRPGRVVTGAERKSVLAAHAGWLRDKLPSKAALRDTEARACYMTAMEQFIRSRRSVRNKRIKKTDGVTGRRLGVALDVAERVAKELEAKMPSRRRKKRKAGERR